jgi:membrane-associated phospholipid phosphatase
VVDAAGALGVVALSGTACGAIAMLGLRLHFPLADGLLRSWDRALGIDGVAITQWLARQPRWTFDLMSPAYNYTIGIFALSLIALSVMRDRLEAWRAAFCFVGTLLTTCLFAIFVPAKGLGVWASQDLFEQLPVQAMRSFWPQFDSFYFGVDPVLSVKAIGGVISFPSFHSVVGFLVLTMWRKRAATLVPATVWLVCMLVATLPGGGHYIVDLLGGFAVWAAWFAGSLGVEAQVARRCKAAQAPAATEGGASVILAG